MSRLKCLNLHCDNDRVKVWHSASSKPRVGVQVAHKAESGVALAATFISRRNAKVLRDWLNRFLSDTKYDAARAAKGGDA